MAYSKEGRYRPTATPAMPKVTVATSTMPKVTVSSNSINTDEGRYRPTATPAMPKVTISYNATNSKEESLSFLERAKDTVFGAWGKAPLLTSTRRQTFTTWGKVEGTR